MILICIGIIYYFNTGVISGEFIIMNNVNWVVIFRDVL